MAYYRRMNRPGLVGIAYYDRHYHDNVTCDACAKAGAVPFTINPRDGIAQQDNPWCWTPRYGDDCHLCGKEC